MTWIEYDWLIPIPLSRYYPIIFPWNTPIECIGSSPGFLAAGLWSLLLQWPSQKALEGLWGCQKIDEIQNLGVWTSINPKYFDVNGTMTHRSNMIKHDQSLCFFTSGGILFFSNNVCMVIPGGWWVFSAVIFQREKYPLWNIQNKGYPLVN